MKISLVVVGAVSAVCANVMPRQDTSECCFQIYATGLTKNISGIMGQLFDGQNRIGGPYPNATYCINTATGTIVDKDNRGCILTPPTTQWQCDEGASPTPGFSISSNGQILHDNKSTFWACPYNQNDGYNFYTEPVENQPYCFEANLTTVDHTCSPVSPPEPAESLTITVTVTVTQCVVKTSTTPFATHATATPAPTPASMSTPMPLPPPTLTWTSKPYFTMNTSGPVPSDVYSAASRSTLASEALLKVVFGTLMSALLVALCN